MRYCSTWGILAIITSGLCSQTALATAVTVEENAQQKTITVTIEGASLANVVRELSERYGFEVEGLDIVKTATLSASLSGNLQSILDTLLGSCNYMIVGSPHKNRNIDRVTIVSCAHLPVPAPASEDDPFNSPEQFF